ncbi:hypothetical protein BC833DRAFT_621144 [Globomyces pollinis-pini]|nr:hypothetical protein BC833DRAFT_621144 [Globomyces pollinis-pini]
MGDQNNLEDTKPKEKTKRKRRKVAKACTLCRKAHVCCDEPRPCGRCVKRGHPELCTDYSKPAKSDSPIPVQIQPKPNSNVNINNLGVMNQNYTQAVDFFQLFQSTSALPMDDPTSVFSSLAVLPSNQISHNTDAPICFLPAPNWPPVQPIFDLEDIYPSVAALGKQLQSSAACKSRGLNACLDCSFNIENRLPQPFPSTPPNANAPIEYATEENESSLERMERNNEAKMKELSVNDQLELMQQMSRNNSSSSDLGMDISNQSFSFGFSYLNGNQDTQLNQESMNVESDQNVVSNQEHDTIHEKQTTVNNPIHKSASEQIEYDQTNNSASSGLNNIGTDNQMDIFLSSLLSNRETEDDSISASGMKPNSPSLHEFLKQNMIDYYSKMDHLEPLLKNIGIEVPIVAHILVLIKNLNKTNLVSKITLAKYSEFLLLGFPSTPTCIFSTSGKILQASTSFSKLISISSDQLNGFCIYSLMDMSGILSILDLAGIYQEDKPDALFGRCTLQVKATGTKKLCAFSLSLMKENGLIWMMIQFIPM